jgi:hypothetical protein
VTAGRRFFDAVPLGRPDVVPEIAYGHRPKKLPTALAPDEVQRLCAAADRDRTLLRTATPWGGASASWSPCAWKTSPPLAAKG